MPAVDFDAEIARIRAHLSDEFGDELAEDNDSVNELIEASLNEWKATASATLTRDMPFRDIEQQMEKYASLSPLHDLYDPTALINKFEVFCLENHEPFDKAFWQQHLAQPLSDPELTDTEAREEARITHVLLLLEWKKILDRALDAWNMHRVAEMRKEFRDEGSAHPKISPTA